MSDGELGSHRNNGEVFYRRGVRMSRQVYFDGMKAYSQLQTALDDDHPNNFFDALNSKSLLDYMGADMSEIGESVIDEVATRCAHLIIDGSTSGLIERDFGFQPDGWSALHQAARNTATDQMVRHLVEAGYSADVRTNGGVLPLNVALRSLRVERLEKKLASPIRSAPTLLNKLYSMDVELEVIRLLALNTSELKREFFNYVKEGKMGEVGALLMAAGEKLMPLSISEGEEDFEFKSFMEISRFLQAKNTTWAMGTVEFLELKETVKLLDIYDKIGNPLSIYVGLKKDRRSGMEVEALLRDAGFIVKTGDHDFEGYVKRSNIASMNFDIPKWSKAPMISSGQIHELIKQMNQTAQCLHSFSKSQQPSMPTRLLPDTPLAQNMGPNHSLLAQNMGPNHAFLPPAINNAVNAIRNLNSKCWASLMRFFPKGLVRGL